MVITMMTMMMMMTIRVPTGHQIKLFFSFVGQEKIIMKGNVITKRQQKVMRTDLWSHENNN